MKAVLKLKMAARMYAKIKRKRHELSMQWLDLDGKEMEDME